MMQEQYDEGEQDQMQEVDENQPQSNFTKIEELENHGINKADITKLKQGGYHTLESLAHASMRKLVEVKGISEQKAQKLKDLIKTNQLVSIGFQTATDRLESMKDIIMLSTGSQDLDVLLGGGVETGCITEVFGEFRTGKTQLCHTLCVTAQRPLDQGGAEGRVIYVDTEGTFRPQKLVAIAERFQMNPEEVCITIIDTIIHHIPNYTH
jgi:DNA repair protein RAD51